MPIYEYECGKCGRHHEVVQRISDKPLARCPSCKGKLTRLISPTAFQLKGTGWYVTDYARKGTGGEKKEGAKGTEKKESAPKAATAGED